MSNIYYKVKVILLNYFLNLIYSVLYSDSHINYVQLIFNLIDLIYIFYIKLSKLKIQWTWSPQNRIKKIKASWGLFKSLNYRFQAIKSYHQYLKLSLQWRLRVFVKGCWVHPCSKEGDHRLRKFALGRS